MAIERDHRAAERLYELRDARGLSPEQLTHELYRAGLEPVCGSTIRRIERIGAIPQHRTKHALATYFGLEVRDIWRPKRRKRKPHTAKTVSAPRVVA
jgi:hypothetical protein